MSSFVTLLMTSRFVTPFLLSYGQKPTHQIDTMITSSNKNGETKREVINSVTKEDIV
jgi:hypothetical protein